MKQICQGENVALEAKTVDKDDNAVAIFQINGSLYSSLTFRLKTKKRKENKNICIHESKKQERE